LTAPANEAGTDLAGDRADLDRDDDAERDGDQDRRREADPDHEPAWKKNSLQENLRFDDVAEDGLHRLERQR
jgi:hypothetical protein